MYVIKDCRPARSSLGTVKLSNTAEVARARVGRSFASKIPLYLTNIYKTMLEARQPLALAVNRSFLPIEVALFFNAAKINPDLQLATDLVFCSHLRSTDGEGKNLVPGFIIEHAKPAASAPSPHTYNQDEIDSLTKDFVLNAPTTLFINCSNGDGSFASDLEIFQRTVALLGYLKAQETLSLLGLDPKDVSFGLKSYISAKYEMLAAKGLLEFIYSRRLNNTSAGRHQLENITEIWLPAIRERLASNAKLIPREEAMIYLQLSETEGVH